MDRGYNIYVQLFFIICICTLNGYHHFNIGDEIYADTFNITTSQRNTCS